MKMRPWVESKGYKPWLLLVLFALLIAVLLKRNILSLTILTQHRNMLDGVYTITMIVVLIAGSVVSYLRFFKGRLWKPKMVINPSAGIVQLKDINLHWIDIGLENRGSVAIWNYVVDLTVDYHRRSAPGYQKPNFHSMKRSVRESELVIDVGEIAYEHATIRIPKDVEVVTYKIVMTSPDGTKWDRCITISNRQEAKA